jgi:hypothetical protein
MISLDELKKKFLILLGSIIKDSIEMEIYKNIELTRIDDLGSHIEVNAQVRVLDKWLDWSGRLTPALVLSIADEATPLLHLIFSHRMATSVELKVSMIDSSFVGEFLFLKLVCNKSHDLITQTFVSLRDCQKLIAVASHNKIYLKEDYKSPKI